MAYTVIDSYRTVQTFGGLASQDVQRVTVASIPSSIAFPVQFTANEQTFDSPSLLAEATAAIAEPYSEYAEDAYARPEVTGLYAYDAPNASNTIEVRWVVTITDPGTQVSTERDIAFIDIRPERFPAVVDQTMAALTALAASGGG